VSKHGSRGERTPQQIQDAARQVALEWTRLADSAHELSIANGARTARDQAAFDSCIVHSRCLINFLCGNTRGEWKAIDIQPIDFLGFAWFPQDGGWEGDRSHFDRDLRGRMAVFNREVFHLSWNRVTNDEVIIWSIVRLAMLVGHAMSLFIIELQKIEHPTLPTFELAYTHFYAESLGVPDGFQETRPILASART